VLTPRRDTPLQVVDVEDLAAWLVLGAEQRRSGTFNALGDASTVGAVLDAAVAAAGTSPRFVEAPDTWLAEHGVEPWTGPESLPLWLPQPEYAGFMTRDNAAARAAGLRLRPLADTVAAALAWERECGLDRDRTAGLTASRERDLLSALAT
jgi:2'-hydroxyisoflavone reductase